MGGGMQVNTTTVRNCADCASNASNASNDLVKNKFREQNQSVSQS